MLKMHYEVHIKSVTVVPLFRCGSEFEISSCFLLSRCICPKQCVRKAYLLWNSNANQSGLATYLRWEHNDSRSLLLNSM